MTSIKPSYYSLLLLPVILVSCHSKPSALFESLPESKTGIHFTNELESHKAFGILYYLYYYNGGGVAIGDVNNDGLPDIYFTANHKGGNKLFLNKGNFQFEDVTEKAGVAGTSDWCTGVTMADVNGDGLLDIYVCAVQGEHGLKGHNELFINNGNGTFTESAEKYGLALSAWSTQAVFFDYDHDGDLDCFVLNQSHHPNENIVDTSNRRKFDPNAGGRLYRNDLNTTGKFTDVSAQAGIIQSSLCYGLGISVADLNNDGWDDIYIGNDFHENDYYYLNNGNGTFTESGAKHFGHYSRFSMGNDIADYNNDGQPDIVTVDMLPPDEKTVKTYGSDEHYDIYQYKIVKNGFQDQVSRNCLQRNNGDGASFSDVGLIAGISATDWSWSPLLADFDNDGRKDLFISSGIVKRPVDLDYVQFVSDLAAKVDRNHSDEYDKTTLEKMPDGSSHPFLFKGDGKMSFKDVSDDWGTGEMHGYYNGAAYADLNNDGNLDLVVNCIESPALVLRNNAPQRNWISIAFHGDGMNKFGIGAKAYVWSGHSSPTQSSSTQSSSAQPSSTQLSSVQPPTSSPVPSPASSSGPSSASSPVPSPTSSSGPTSASMPAPEMQYQELMLTRGFQSSCDPRLHFGLDSAAIDSLLIVWPDQKYQLIRNPAINRQLEVRQSDATGKFDYNSFFPKKKPLLENISSQIACTWKHKENDFNDFSYQYLIPHKESTRGPKIAVCDVNGDGLDDFYVCGAKGQPKMLMIQLKDGHFIPSDTALFKDDAICEDVDATFFDANGDGFPDLYIVSGGNEAPVVPHALEDRLYLNDGKGHFRKSPPFISQLYDNKSCITVADVDHDGDLDIFIGTLANTRGSDYGVPQTSHLYLNDGKGHFSIAVDNIHLDKIGIVTCAAFSDLNGDGWPDLIVSGEWMPLKIFMNDHGKFKETDVPNSTGLWQTLCIADVNGDGHPDILAGNWGHNSKLWAGKDGPLKLYVKDFDFNGRVDQVMCYTIKGKEYTFLAKDQLERTIPVLKKGYLHYDEVAGKTVQYMFDDLFKDYTELKAETLSSSCFLGDGKGGFARTDLPGQLQLAPVFSFAPIPGQHESATPNQSLPSSPGQHEPASSGPPQPRPAYIAAGNFYGVIPYEGKYDALFPTLFSIGDTITSMLPDATPSLLPDARGEVRDIKWLRGPDGKKIMIIARNNDSLLFYLLNK